QDGFGRVPLACAPVRATGEEPAEQPVVQRGTIPGPSCDHLLARQQDGSPEPYTGARGHDPGDREEFGLPRTRDPVSRAERRRLDRLRAQSVVYRVRRIGSGARSAVTAL